MRATRLIFVEGLIGAGKSTTAQRIVDHLVPRGLAATLVPEGDKRLRVARQLAQPFAPWSGRTPDAFVELCREAWSDYVATVDREAVTVCDGLLFHGNMTDLLLMGADRAAFARYLDVVLAALRPLAPSLIYLRPVDVWRLLRATFELRGQEWVAYQTGWKLASPYARSRGLEGAPGLIRLYEDFRDVCDELVAKRALPTLTVDDTQPWAKREEEILAWLDA